MEKGLEFFDAWAKTQKELIESSLKSQEIFRSHWLASMRKTQEAFLASVSTFDNPQSKEALKLFNTWFNSVISSTELFNEEAQRIQKTWEKLLDNQLEQSKEIAKGFTDFLSKQATRGE